MHADMDDEICQFAMIAYQLCKPRYGWLYQGQATVVLSGDDDNNPANGLQTQGWHVCEERCALTPACKQVVFHKSSHRCIGYADPQGRWDTLSSSGATNSNYISA